MGNTCTSCNCNNQNEPSELLTVDHKVFKITFLQFYDRQLVKMDKDKIKQLILT